MAIDVESRVILRTIYGLEKKLPYIFHQGGTSSGKTFGILYALLFFALKFLNKGAIVSIVGETLPSLKRGAITDFQIILNETGIRANVKENKSNYTYYLPNDIRFEFFAIDNEQKAKNGKRDILFINEANNLLWTIANQLMMRTRGPKILDWNPSGKFWLHRMLLPSLGAHEYLFTRSTYRDNKFADPEIVRGIERLKSIDPTLYAVYGQGVEGYGTEIIYPKWQLVDSFPDTRRIAYGLDFGYTNHPSACVRGALYEGALYFDELFYQKGLSNRQIADNIQQVGVPIGSGVADSAEPKSIAELQSYGLDIRGAIKGQDSVKFGISRIKQYPIFITKQSVHVIDEIEGYKWIMKDGVPTEKPKPGNDHALDSMRYLAEELLQERASIRMSVRSGRELGLTEW